jgi:predicted anti-sigma-YlaC factor YlaD
MSNHIKALLDGAPFSELSRHDLKIIEDHVESCEECRDAHTASRLSQLMLNQRVSEEIEPTPFFHTRVMAAIREKEKKQTNIFALLWRSAGPVFSALLVIVAVLAGLSFYPADSNELADVNTAMEIYTTDAVFSAPAIADNDMPYDQVLTVLYESEVSSR